MNSSPLPPKSEQAFYHVDTSKIRDAVIALINELGLSQGSISATEYKRYDFYTLIETYIKDTESRLKIHKIIDKR